MNISISIKTTSWLKFFLLQCKIGNVDNVYYRTIFKKNLFPIREILKIYPHIFVFQIFVPQNVAQIGGYVSSKKFGVTYAPILRIT